MSYLQQLIPPSRSNVLAPPPLSPVLNNHQSTSISNRGMPASAVPANVYPVNSAAVSRKSTSISYAAIIVIFCEYHRVPAFIVSLSRRTAPCFQSFIFPPFPDGSTSVNAANFSSNHAAISNNGNRNTTCANAVNNSSSSYQSGVSLQDRIKDVPQSTVITSISIPSSSSAFGLSATSSQLVRFTFFIFHFSFFVRNR